MANTIEEGIRRSLGRAQSTDPESRVRVYEAAERAILRVADEKNLPDEVVDRQIRLLIGTIEEIEAEYAARDGKAAEEGGEGGGASAQAPEAGPRSREDAARTSTPPGAISTAGAKTRARLAAAGMAARARSEQLARRFRQPKGSAKSSTGVMAANPEPGTGEAESRTSTGEVDGGPATASDTPRKKPVPRAAMIALALALVAATIAAFVYFTAPSQDNDADVVALEPDPEASPAETAAEASETVEDVLRSQSAGADAVEGTDMAAEWRAIALEPSNFTAENGQVEQTDVAGEPVLRLLPTGEEPARFSVALPETLSDVSGGSLQVEATAMTQAESEVDLVLRLIHGDQSTPRTRFSTSVVLQPFLYQAPISGEAANVRVEFELPGGAAAGPVDLSALNVRPGRG